MASLLASRPSRTVLGSLFRSRSSTASVLDRLLEASGFQNSEPEVFLAALESAAQELQVEKADRSYRNKFTENYRVLFAREERCYLVSLFDACQAGHTVWVNGGSHEMEASAKMQAQSLRRSLASLNDILDRWAKSTLLGQTPEVKSLLARFDKTWALFEERYILWLIQVAEQARAPLMAAIGLERELFSQECHVHKFRNGQGIRMKQIAQSPKRRRETSEGTLCLRSREPSSAESPCSIQCAVSENQVAEHLGSSFFPGEMSLPGEVPQCDLASGSGTSRTENHLLMHTSHSASSRHDSGACRQVMQSLVAQIAKLNALANVQGRGREDLTFDVLQSAADALEGTLEKTDGKLSAAASARHLVACRVLSSFADMRSYLAEVQQLEPGRLHPQLSNNTQLVKLLAAWEDAWELGARFLLKAEVLEALCEVCAHMARARSFSPELSSMLEDQDAEIFLILPRILLLCCLMEPTNFALPAMFLPHHFGRAESRREGEDCDDGALSEEVLVLQELFEKATAFLKSSHTAVWDALARRAIAGSGKVERDAVEVLMLKLEGLSVELQRHRPEEWNRCCSLLLQCIDAAAAPPQKSVVSL
eukprot:TRINITY_DN13068_c0_g1_i5.p1 TRINITY_DN13068_c0_g1~~TRINITY_DN13068_c0_g1_i5.p1  ORF type:complete len:625 (+),score=146.94 TRINITY_DN13068_c0_g1_i5:94-1875(+)